MLLTPLVLNRGPVVKSLPILGSIRMYSSGPNQPKLAGKVAVVTGSTDGIGLSMARRLGKDGASLVISSRRQSNVDNALSLLSNDGINVCGVTCDVASKEQREFLIKKAVEEYGGIDIFVGNAAANSSKTLGLLNCSDETWDFIMETNLKANFHFTKLVHPHMKERNGGVIVYVGSAAAYFTPWVLGCYVISKTGLISLTKLMAQELVKDNIRVNYLAPGIIKTKFAKNLIKQDGFDNVINNVIHMKRTSEVDEYDGAISFLCGPESSYMTGESLRIDGGIVCRL